MTRALAWLLMACAVAPLRAEVRIAEREVRYVLDAYTLHGLQRQLEHELQAAPGAPARSAHGLTRSEIELAYATEPRLPRGCRVDALQVRLNLSMTLPEWRPRIAPSTRVERQVMRMMAGLAVHEAGHRRHALLAAATIERRLSEQAPAPDCAVARRAIERTFRRESMRLQLRDQHYDIATGHGRTQGAQLEVPVHDRNRSATR